MADEEEQESPVEAVGDTAADIVETVEDAATAIEETITESAGDIRDDALEQIRAELETVKSGMAELRGMVEKTGETAAAPVEAVQEGFAEVEAPSSPEPPAEERRRKRAHDIMRRR